MIRQPAHQSQPETRTSGNPRGGATLVEVLMSLLIMSIGIVSVFSLFPVAILSSIKATQLTNGKLLQENVVELLRANPQLVLGATPWQPNTPYNNSQFVAVKDRSGGVLAPSNVYFRSGSGGTSGSTEPNWGATLPITDGTVSWTTSGSYTSYVIDPLGYEQQQGTFQGFFGNDGTNPTSLLRLDLPTTLNLSINNLRPNFYLGDSWTTVVQAVPTAATATTIDFPTSVDLTAVDATHRVSVASSDGRYCATRSVQSAPSGQTITLASPNLPGQIDSLAEIGTARIEVFNRRYTWFLTVNRTASGQTRIQCPIVFNRSYNSNDEVVFNYTSTTANPDTATVSAVAGVTPTISEGNYAFDINSCRWYKIVTAPTSLPGDVVLDSALSSTTGKLMFMPGIIKVFDIEL